MSEHPATTAASASTQDATPPAEIPVPSRVTEWAFPVIAAVPIGTGPGHWALAADRGERPHGAGRTYCTWEARWQPETGEYAVFWGEYELTRDQAIASMLDRAGLLAAPGHSDRPAGGGQVPASPTDD